MALVFFVQFVVIVIPGLLAGRKLEGPPRSGAIFDTGGFHCPGDGPNRIHYHTCLGDPVPIPEGAKPSDYPDYVEGPAVH
jgi:hypothetical protein